MRYTWTIPCSKSDKTANDRKKIAADLEKVLKDIPDGAKLCIKGLDDCEALENVFTIRREKAELEKSCLNYNEGTTEGDEFKDIPLDDIFMVPAGSGFNCFTRSELENIETYMESKDPYTRQVLDIKSILQQNKFQQLLEDDNLVEEPVKSMEDQITDSFNKIFDQYGANSPDVEEIFFATDTNKAKKYSDQTGKWTGEYITPYNTPERMISLIANIYHNIPQLRHRLGSLSPNTYMGDNNITPIPVLFEPCMFESAIVSNGSSPRLLCLQLTLAKTLDFSHPPNGLKLEDMDALKFTSQEDAKNFRGLIQRTLKEIFENY